MSRTFSKSLVTQLAVVVLMSLTLAPVAEAARGGGGGQARASAGTRQVDNSRADARTNNVRSTSTNNVNTNRNTNVNTNVNASRNTNVNVNVNNNGGWDNDYHPVAGAMAVGAAVAVTAAIIGSTVATVPPGCVPVNYVGMVYQQWGDTWYQPQGSQFIVVNPPY